MTSIDSPARRPSATVRAGASQIVGAAALDLTVLAVAVALVAAAVAAEHPDLVILSTLVLLAVVVGQLAAWSRTGRSFGAVVTGMRWVTTVDEAPPGLDRALAPGWFADLRRGRDPVAPAPTTPLLPPVAPNTAAPTRNPVSPLVPEAPAVRPSPRVLLVVDGAAIGTIGEGVVVGRNPTPGPGERAVTIADLSREISKAHLGLRTDGAGRVWAVDRNSTNGSLLTRADGSEGRLVPGAEVEVAPGDVIRIGNHTITLQLVNEVRVAVR